MDKLQTGISGLDEILEGGIPKGHIVMVSGSAGTGKTILSMQFLCEGAKKGETSLYLAFSEPKEKILANLEGLSFFDKKLVESGKIRVVDMTQDARLRSLDLQNVPGMISLFKDLITESGATRVVLDSITSLAANLGTEKNIRDFIFSLGIQVAYIKCTLLMISEVPPQTFVYSAHGIEEFIADGVILLSEFDRKGDLIRSLQVIKMRGVAHSRNKQVLKITSDGIKLIPMFKAGIE